MKDKILSIVYAVSVAVLVISFSIGLPIWCRPFYYAHINALDMPERTGYDYETIKDAYDEMLDFCTMPGKEFGTGELRWSEDGKSHFADCKKLFMLDGIMFIISLCLTVALIIMKRKGVFRPKRPFGMDLTFSSGVFTLVTFAAVAALAAIDFDVAFTVFHKIFFPGKDNWRFNSYTDQIIKVMPQEFFMNCAILIVSSIILICTAMIVVGIIKRDKKAK